MSYPRGPRAYYNADPRTYPAPHTHRAPGLPPIWAGGDIGINTELSPITPIDQSGREVFIPKDSSYKPAIPIHLDSEARDHDAYPDPTDCVLRFPKPQKGVYSIELLNMILPTADSAPDGFYILLKVPGLEHFDVMHSTNLNAGQAMNTHASEAFAKIPFIPGATVQMFSKRELRMIKFFSPLRDFQQLHFQVTDKYGDRYDMDMEDDWSATLEVVSYA